ncbi:hypothetical protein HDU98_002236 [Podochytrium sp. JEL0797]|nr:hypothetical protein HDU98_002236 [Podochytrium sp. JEL0797]
MASRPRIPLDPVSSVFSTSTGTSSSPSGTDVSSSLSAFDEFDRDAFPLLPPTIADASILDILPYEVFSRIFWHLDALETVQTASMGFLPAVVTGSTLLFRSVCKSFQHVSEDPHARAGWLITRYGYAWAFYYAFKYHRGILTPTVGHLMLAAGCHLPRYLLQLVNKEYNSRVERTRRPISIQLWMFFVEQGYRKYTLHSDFREDDVGRFERSLYGVTNTAQESTDIAKDLINNYLFVPVRGLGSPVDETVYLVSKLDVNLITGLIRNGLDIRFVNDSIMERLLWRADITEPIVASYVRVGFELSSPAVKKGLQMGRAGTLEILRKYVSPAMLQTHAEDTVFDMFGPSIRGWNFTAEAMDFLFGAFPISDECMERAILRHPNGIDPASPDSFPSTRSYMKANPCPVWRWVLGQYGPSHHLTMACFDDAISRAAAEHELHALHDIFLEAGVQFRPRHVKILACRVLHRDMTANALHLLKVMKVQILASAREYYKQQHDLLELESSSRVVAEIKKPEGTTSASSFGFIFGSGMSTAGLTTMWGASSASAAVAGEPVMSTFLTAGGHTFEPVEAPPVPTNESVVDAAVTHMSAMTSQTRSEWIKSFNDEVLGNEEWETRMRTTQLEGGPRGGAYRITQAPEDGVQFLQECKDILRELNGMEEKWVTASVKVGAGKVGGGAGKARLGRSVSSGGSGSRPSALPKSSPMRNRSIEARVGGSRSARLSSSPLSQHQVLFELDPRPHQALDLVRDESGFLLGALNATEEPDVIEDATVDLEVGVDAEAGVPDLHAETDDVDVAEVEVRIQDGPAPQEMSNVGIDEDDDTVTVTPTNAHASASGISREENGLFTNGFRVYGTNLAGASTSYAQQPTETAARPSSTSSSSMSTPEPGPSGSSSSTTMQSRLRRKMSALWSGLNKNNKR